MGNKKNIDEMQLSLFDALIREIGRNTVSSENIEDMVKQLEKAKADVIRREEEEKIRKAKREEEEKRRQAEKEERERRHVEKVTSMDLP